jgi:hypothetical protein
MFDRKLKIQPAFLGPHAVALISVALNQPSRIANAFFRNVTKFKYLKKTVINQMLFMVKLSPD